MKSLDGPVTLQLTVLCNSNSQSVLFSVQKHGWTLVYCLHFILVFILINPIEVKHKTSRLTLLATCHVTTEVEQAFEAIGIYIFLRGSRVFYSQQTFNGSDHSKPTKGKIEQTGSGQFNHILSKVWQFSRSRLSVWVEKFNRQKQLRALWFQCKRIRPSRLLQNLHKKMNHQIL